MGILNVTPDSFSDGGQFTTVKRALEQASNLAAFGTDILDVGGQSTRPGAETIALEEELQRVVPVIEAIRQSDHGTLRNLPISVDTTRVEVAKAAVAAGADMVNDISAGTFEPAMLSTVAQLGVPIFLMHIRGTPVTMQQLTDYDDLLAEILAFLEQRILAARKAGVAPELIAVDPGLGFAKTYDQNLEILRNLDKFRQLGCPLLVGSSRKSFIGRILQESDPQRRVWGTAAACCSAIAKGADILRVHDGLEMIQVAKVADQIWR
jgi:dihydropteroate synthase